MSLDTILAEIRREGQEQVDEIMREAEQEADAVLQEARTEAQGVHESTLERVMMPAYRERARIMHRGRLEALQTLGEARESMLDEALTRARQHLAQCRADPRYPHILRKLTEEVLDALHSSLEEVHTIHLHVDPRDEPLIAQILDDLDLELSVSGSLNCWGGIVASSEDDQIVAINTLESRLERAMPTLRRQLATLFEEGGATRPDSITETPVYGP